MSYRSYTELVLYGELPTRQRAVQPLSERWYMKAPSITRRALPRTKVNRWAWWELPPPIRIYVALVVLCGLGITAYAGSQTTWHALEGIRYSVLASSALISVAATPRSAYRQGAITRDFITVWVVPVAILLPPVYAMMLPVPLYVLTLCVVHRANVHRKIFTAEAIAMAYGAASLVFRAFPASFAGDAIGTGAHALKWVLAVIICEQVGRRGHQVYIIGAIKLSDRAARLSRTEWSNEALIADFAEFDLGVLITVVVSVNVLLAVLAVPTVLLARRFMMHRPLV